MKPGAFIAFNGLQNVNAKPRLPNVIIQFPLNETNMPHTHIYTHNILIVDNTVMKWNKTKNITDTRNHAINLILYHATVVSLIKTPVQNQKLWGLNMNSNFENWRIIDLSAIEMKKKRMNVGPHTHRHTQTISSINTCTITLAIV